MTREEQLDLASGRYAYVDNRPACCRASFERGAEWADGNRWVKVDDVPLVIYSGNNWQTTDAGSREFIAALQYEDLTKPGKLLWWIRHCVIEDNTGLCIVGDDENTPAGWDIRDVTHYQPIPEPPKSEQ